MKMPMQGHSNTHECEPFLCLSVSAAIPFRQTHAGELQWSSKKVQLRQLEDADKNQQLSEREAAEAMPLPR